MLTMTFPSKMSEHFEYPPYWFMETFTVSSIKTMQQDKAPPVEKQVTNYKNLDVIPEYL